MSSLSPHVSIGQLVAEQPNRARVFEEYGIDYCCGGRKPLSEACQAKGLDSQAVLRRLLDQDQTQPQMADRDWSAASMAELCDHIEATHHDYLRRELPRLSALVEKVAEVHGGREPSLREVATIFREFCSEINLHMMKEEQVLFPLIRRLDSSSSPVNSHCGSVNNPIGVMEHEHDTAGRALEQMHDLTRGFTPTPDACNTYRVLMDGLARLTRDMHQHIHKENNILFPRASSTEARLAHGH